MKGSTMAQVMDAASDVKVRAEFGWSDAASAREALEAILGDEGAGPGDLGMVFVSPSYDMDEVAEAIRGFFPCPVLACTTAGEVTSKFGYRSGGISAACVHGLSVSFATVPEVRAFTMEEARYVTLQLGASPSAMFRNRVAITLIDGKSYAEERFSAYLSAALGGVPMIGGSAGDDERDARTLVFDGERFVSGAAVVALVDSPRRVSVLAHHNYEPTESVLVVTAADPDSRIVYEFNGRPAAAEYAAALGTSVDRLDPITPKARPLLLKYGTSYFVRGFSSRILGSGALQMYCAIEEGVPLRIGRQVPMGERLREVLREHMSERTALVLGFDCIARSTVARADGCVNEVMEVLSAAPMVGFCTYGEQINGMHVNQTLTSLILES